MNTTTDDEHTESRREYRKAYYARQREKLLAAREIAEGLGVSKRGRGRPKLSDEERLKRRQERQRKYYERKVGHEVAKVSLEGLRAKWRERYRERQAKLGKAVVPRQDLTPEERLEHRRERQREYQRRKTEQARKWREAKTQAVREGLAGLQK